MFQNIERRKLSNLDNGLLLYAHYFITMVEYWQQVSRVATNVEGLSKVFTYLHTQGPTNHRNRS